MASERIHRLLRLVGILQSGRAYNSQQLADQCHVSRRTIFRDLKTLHDSGIEFLYHDERQGYALPRGRSLPPMELTLDEALALLVLCHDLGDERRGVPFHGAAKVAALKLLSALPRKLGDYVSEVGERVSLRMEPQTPLDGQTDTFDLLRQAAVERRQVRVRYDSFTEREVISTVISPYRLLFVRHSWYVIGRSSLHRMIRTLNVARVESAELLDKKFRVPPRFGLDRLLGNAWNLIRDPGRREYSVRVRFQPLVARNVAEVRWRKTQRTTLNPDGTLDFRVQVSSLKEIEWWLLGYGAQVEVLEPAELRRAIVTHADAMRAIYADTKPRRRRPRKTRSP